MTRPRFLQTVAMSGVDSNGHGIPDVLQQSLVGSAVPGAPVQYGGPRGYAARVDHGFISVQGCATR